MATPARKPAPPAWLTGAALAVCALAVWAVYGAARHFQFVLWDDDHNLQLNPHLGGVTWDNLRWMFTDTAYSRRYFPLTWLGWNLDHDLFGLTARSAHLGNILFHVLNTILVFFVVRTAARIWLARENLPGPGPATVAAAVGALAWALHPLRVEVVAWASGRIYAQSACFLLLSLWVYLRSLEAAPGSPVARRFRLASLLALALSLLTYPLALSYVGVLLLLDWYLPRRLAAGSSRPYRAALREKIPFLVLTAVILGLTLWARTNVSAVGWKPPVTLAEFGVLPRVLQAGYVWTYYLWKPLLPFHLSPYYARLVSFHASDWDLVASLVAVAGLTVILFLRRRRWPGAWLLWLCHLVVLAPVLGLTEHPHFTSDRYSYVAGVLWSVALTVIIIRLWPRRGPRLAALVVSGVGLVALAALSAAQVAVWRDTETLGLHMIAQLGEHPRRFEIYRRMATALREEGRPEESNAYYLKSLGDDPHAAEEAISRAAKLEDQGKLHEASVQYLLAAQLRPDLAEPRYRLGAILLAEDHAVDALPFLREAVQLQPGLTDARIALGWALNRTGQAPEAAPQFERALEELPEDAAAHSGLGTALVAIGRPREAVPHFEWVVRLFPDSALAHYNLGLALLDGLGKKTAAAAEFTTVLKLQPDFPGARDALERCRR